MARPTFLIVLAALAACTDSAPADRVEPGPEAPAPAAATPAVARVAGRYGCTASRATADGIEYQMKGSITLAADGAYTYQGFEQPSAGRFQADSGGVLYFAGGFLDGGEATPVEDRPGKFFVVAPGIPEHRWTCGQGEGG